MPRLRAETRARARALQALYAWEVRPDEPLERVASQVWDGLCVAADQRAFATQIIRTITAEAESIDEALRDVTTNWRLERLGAVERAVLRIAAAELRNGEPPTRVSIQEAVYLAERFGSAQSARFVNGVLDALARKMGRL
jgi:N utilization substance protein B